MAEVASSEFDLFAETTRAYLDKTMPVARVRELHELDIACDRTWWQQGAELGWTSMLVSEDLGGGNVSGSGIADLALVAEMMGTVASAGPLVPVSVVLAALSETRSHASVIEQLVEGTAIAAWAVYDPGQPFTPLQPKVVAEPVPGGYRLNGTKDRVEAGGYSDYFLVTAATDGQLRQFLIPSDHPGVTVTPQDGIDMVRSFAAVSFADVELPSSTEVGIDADAGALVERQCQIAQVLQCAETVGALRTVFDFTAAWATDRHSFGRPLASYQALKHRFADLKTHLEACRAATAAAVREVGSRSARASLVVSTAAAYVGQHAPTMIQDCIQLHGGIGVTWEHDLHVFLRRVSLNQAMYGTPDHHNRRVYDWFDAMEAAR